MSNGEMLEKTDFLWGRNHGTLQEQLKKLSTPAIEGITERSSQARLVTERQ